MFFCGYVVFLVLKLVIYFYCWIKRVVSVCMIFINDCRFIKLNKVIFFVEVVNILFCVIRRIWVILGKWFVLIGFVYEI